MRTSWAGEVLIVGAGLAGLLIARRLRGMGVEVTLVEKEGIGAGQSNHSHGYLHRGYIYSGPDRRLIEEFRTAQDLWASLVKVSGMEPVATESCIAFANPVTAMAFARGWQDAGLSVETCAAPVGLSPDMFASCYATAEASYDMTQLFEWLRREDGEALVVKGVAERVVVDGERVCGVDVAVAEGRLRLIAGCYVFAAGIGNEPLLATAIRFKGRASARTAHMLVLMGSHLPSLSCIGPEHELYGLFIVSRPSPTGHVWLVSNYLSTAMAGWGSDLAKRYWCTATLSTVRRYTSALSRNTVHGVYAAPKAELRADPRVLQGHSIETYGLANCLVVAPTKLTLAPVLADAAADRIVQRPTVRRPRRLANLQGGRLADFPVSPERWRQVDLSSL